MMANTKKEFGCFDVVSDDSDHRFLGKNVGGNCFSDTKTRVYKRIMKEWKILEKNLPESIYVRAYERHINLLRAVIVGAAGTPYHDGLFFFDIAIPNDYPNKPPKIHYHSFGLRLNPNLYADGKVCLSLLNTWAGKKGEMWDPSNSTLLQVLLSIQALVLNEKPFFNEPLFSVFNHRIFEKKSRAYNEIAFTLTCHTSLHLIRRPPKNFEDFVKEHYRSRACVILTACREYANGRVMVGYYYSSCNSNNTVSRKRSTIVKVSPSLQKWVEGFYLRLHDAFVRCGASLEPSFKSLELQAKPSKSKKGGIFKKAMAKIKQALGWKSGTKKEEES